MLNVKSRWLFILRWESSVRELVVSITIFAFLHDKSCAIILM